MSWRLVVWFCVLLRLSWSRDFTFTISVKSGTKECFYEVINEGAFLEVEYQVPTNCVFSLGVETQQDMQLTTLKMTQLQ